VVYLILLLIPIAMAISLPLCAVLVRLGHRLGTFDGAGVVGQVKEAPRRVPNTGGIAIVAGFVAPVLGILGVAALAGSNPDAIPTVLGLQDTLGTHAPGIGDRAPLALVFLGSILALHILGLIDDRRPLGPWIKLAAILGAATSVALTDQTRLLTMLDQHVGGAWLSVAVTVVWIAVVTNAFNFMDNMDGLSGGAAAVASACFMTAALVNGQWFIAGLLALLVGALLAFLVFNFPPARIFMGDGGSLVIGFILAVLTVRTTYYAPPGTIVDGQLVEPAGAGWHTVFMPLVILAVPLYDFVSVVVIRLSQGRSPFMGDLQHFSHRLVRRGLSKRAAVLIIWGFTLVTGIAGITLATLEPWQAVLVGVQTLAILGVIAAFEYGTSERHKQAKAQQR
jgi:UDP-GlcNAc:undecaprenyl-phosphate GlcNAc-1-phosphate transferase